MVPPWATREAADLVASAILAADPVPIADDQATHAAVVRIRASAYRASLYRDAMAASGVPTAMPFFDRAVVEACLAVRPWERTDPWQPKPLLRAALADVAPANLLCRRTKSGYNADILHGWTIHHDRIGEMLARPQVVEHGLVDPDRLRHVLTAFGPSGLPPAWVTDLIAIETWLRDLDMRDLDMRDLDCDRDSRAAPPRIPDTHRTAVAVGRRAAHRSIRLARTVHVTPVDDGVTLLEARRGTVYHLNRAGAVILAALAEDIAEDTAAGVGTAVQSAVAALVSRFGIPAGQARADVTALLNQLDDHGLLAQAGKAGGEAR